MGDSTADSQQDGEFKDQILSKAHKNAAEQIKQFKAEIIEVLQELYNNTPRSIIQGVKKEQH